MPSNRDVAEESELGEGDVKSSVDELPDMLQGANVEERECAACIMANIAKDPASCESLLNASVIRTASPLLLDKNCAVRHSIAGALRVSHSRRVVPSAPARRGRPRHCLHAVSEDNVELAESMSDFKAALGILQTPSQEPGTVLLQVLSAGILINVSEAQETPLAPFVLPIVSVLGSALSLPVVENIKALAETVAELRASAKKRNVDTHLVEEKERVIERTLALVLDGLMAKQTALEILSNLCCGEDGGSKDDEYENVSDDSSDGFEGGMDTDDTSAIFPLNISCEFHEALVGQNIVSKVMDHISQLDKKLSSLLVDHTLSAAVPLRIHAVRCRALLCIGNLAQALEPDDFGSTSGLVSTWTCLAQLAFVHMDFEDLELLEASTSACRSVLQALATAAANSGTDVPPLPSVSDEELRVLTEVGLQCSEPAVRTNVTRIMATLGCLLGTHQANVLKKVGQYLLEVASKDSDIVVVTEALDATFDVFGEDTTDAVATEIDLVTKLRQLLPAFNCKRHSFRCVQSL
ncbi:hypothetical protein HPB48_024599 [Haemaphysalis longicornis]|uniref:SYO1-like TPR repeats domain-containing protein n=1 Tax=Haemaphysalis longicornis TaxID=44386 RepID=A0A9J6H811_HAELO|nr:hypothetical protein HPB48_024599 [Haemaphysalis longicornis]